MTILRARSTRRFLYLFVRCRCGKRFGHRGDRRLIVCYACGRISEATAVPWAESRDTRAARRRKRAAAAAAWTASTPASRRGRPAAHSTPGHLGSRLERRVGVLYRRLVRPLRRPTPPGPGKS